MYDWQITATVSLRWRGKDILPNCSANFWFDFVTETCDETILITSTVCVAKNLHFTNTCECPHKTPKLLICNMRNKTVLKDSSPFGWSNFPFFLCKNVASNDFLHRFANRNHDVFGGPTRPELARGMREISLNTRRCRNECSRLSCPVGLSWLPSSILWNTGEPPLFQFRRSTYAQCNGSKSRSHPPNPKSKPLAPSLQEPKREADLCETWKSVPKWSGVPRIPPTLPIFDQISGDRSYYFPKKSKMIAFGMQLIRSSNGKERWRRENQGPSNLGAFALIEIVISDSWIIKLQFPFTKKLLCALFEFIDKAQLYRKHQSII